MKRKCEYNSRDDMKIQKQSAAKLKVIRLLRFKRDAGKHQVSLDNGESETKSLKQNGELPSWSWKENLCGVDDDRCISAKAGCCWADSTWYTEFCYSLQNLMTAFQMC